jgi:hypothetical protein
VRVTILSPWPSCRSHPPGRQKLHCTTLVENFQHWPPFQISDVRKGAPELLHNMQLPHGHRATWAVFVSLVEVCSLGHCPLEPMDLTVPLCGPGFQKENLCSVSSRLTPFGGVFGVFPRLGWRVPGGSKLIPAQSYSYQTTVTPTIAK